MSLHVDDPGFQQLARSRGDRPPFAARAKTACPLHPSDGLPGYPPGPERLAAITRICEEVAALPVLDDRSDEEILGYDASGLPT